MAKNEILGVAECHVCKARGRKGRARIKRNCNGRLYSHCENPDCRTEIRYEPDGAYRHTDVPGFTGAFEVAALRNVTAPVTKPEPAPAPVTQPETTGGANDWW